MTFLFFKLRKKDGFYAQSERKKPLLAFALCKIEEDALPHISHFVNSGLLKPAQWLPFVIVVEKVLGQISF